jgi:hypothetical protein
MLPSVRIALTKHHNFSVIPDICQYWTTDLQSVFSLFAQPPQDCSSAPDFGSANAFRNAIERRPRISIVVAFELATAQPNLAAIRGLQNF